KSDSRDRGTQLSDLRLLESNRDLGEGRAQVEVEIEDRTNEAGLSGGEGRVSHCALRRLPLSAQVWPLRSGLLRWNSGVRRRREACLANGRGQLRSGT